MDIRRDRNCSAPLCDHCRRSLSTFSCSQFSACCFDTHAASPLSSSPARPTMSARPAYSTTSGAPTTANTMQASAQLGRSFSQLMRAVLPQIVGVLRLLLSNVVGIFGMLRQALVSGMTVTANNRPAVVVKGVGQQ